MQSFDHQSIFSNAKWWWFELTSRTRCLHSVDSSLSGFETQGDSNHQKTHQIAPEIIQISRLQWSVDDFFFQLSDLKEKCEQMGHPISWRENGFFEPHRKCLSGKENWLLAQHFSEDFGRKFFHGFNWSAIPGARECSKQQCHTTLSSAPTPIRVTSQRSIGKRTISSWLETWICDLVAPVPEFGLYHKILNVQKMFPNSPKRLVMAELCQTKH